MNWNYCLKHPVAVALFLLQSLIWSAPKTRLLPPPPEQPIGIANFTGSCWVSAACQLVESMRMHQPELFEKLAQQGVEQNPGSLISGYVQMVQSKNDPSNKPPYYRYLPLLDPTPLAEAFKHAAPRLGLVQPATSVLLENSYDPVSGKLTQKELSPHLRTVETGNSVELVVLALLEEFKDLQKQDTGSPFTALLSLPALHQLIQENPAIEEKIPPFVLVRRANFTKDVPPTQFSLNFATMKDIPYELTGIIYSIPIPLINTGTLGGHVMVLIRTPTQKWFLCNDTEITRFENTQDATNWQETTAKSSYIQRDNPSQPISSSQPIIMAYARKNQEQRRKLFG